MCIRDRLRAFSSACGCVSGWFTGRSCRDRLWKRAATTSKRFMHQCIWRGRRGSDLARGRWKRLVDVVARSSANDEVRARMGALPPISRTRVMSGLDQMILSWRDG
eukprot:1317805-Pyramimonas_sp.AAC.1